MPYSSTEATAEWIEETPLLIGADAGFSALPNLGTVTFSGATVNGANAHLNSAEAMQLIDGNGNPIATPSAPNSHDRRLQRLHVEQQLLTASRAARA